MGMRFVIDMDDSDIIYKESGELPEQFRPYIFVCSIHSKVYYAMVGFYRPYYDNNKGGVYDGIGGHIGWDQIVAWKSLEDMQVNCVPESDVGQKLTDIKQEIKWIPVTDRYPDNSRKVLVTYKYDDEYEIEIGEYWNLAPDAKKKSPEEFGFGLRHKDVIAWAELPKPYAKNCSDEHTDQKETIGIKRYLLLVTAEDWNHDGDEWLGIYVNDDEAWEAYNRAIARFEAERESGHYSKSQKVMIYEFDLEDNVFKSVNPQNLKHD